MLHILLILGSRIFRRILQSFRMVLNCICVRICSWWINCVKLSWIFWLWTWISGCLISISFLAGESDGDAWWHHDSCGVRLQIGYSNFQFQDFWFHISKGICLVWVMFVWFIFGTLLGREILDPVSLIKSTVSSTTIHKLFEQKTLHPESREERNERAEKRTENI